MKVISIDNCYEDDGLAQAQQLLVAHQWIATAGDELIAIIPEYQDGRLDRLNFVTQAAGDPVYAGKRLEQLREVTAAIIADRKAAHDAAIKKLDDEGPIGFVPTAGDQEKSNG